MNKEIANQIGLSTSTIYKIRQGNRHPSFKSMLRIEKSLGWSVNEQTTARRKGNYSEEFVKRIS